MKSTEIISQFDKSMFLFSSHNTQFTNAASACCFEMLKNVFFFISGHEILHFSVKLISLFVFHPLFIYGFVVGQSDLNH